jgi:hypothetical protein
MKKTHRGSCHCGAVRFECEVDLSAGTNRCNCGFCQKARWWMVFVKASEFRLLAGADVLSDYQYTPAGKPEPFLHFEFCSRCGFRPFTRGGALPQFGGEFYAVNVACLEGLSDAELAALPVNYADGRHENWGAKPDEVRHL